MIDAEQMARDWYADLVAIDKRRERSIQTEQRKIGVSDLFSCRERVIRFISEEPFTDTTSFMAAFIGTACHEFILPKMGALHPHLLIECELEVELPSGFVVLAHADYIDPRRRLALDLKTVDGLAYVKRVGPNMQQRIQRSLYGVGAVQAGLLPAEGVSVGNVWLDRSGKSEEVVVQVEPLDAEWALREADAWLVDVRNGMLDPDRGDNYKDEYYDKCKMFCPFFTGCRGNDVPNRVITQPDLIEAADTYSYARTMAAVWKETQEEAKERLTGVEGVTTSQRIRWVTVNGTEKRAGYDRLDVTSIGGE